jgi:hypothetical protein
MKVKKHIIILAALLLTLALPMRAQVFTMEDDVDNPRVPGDLEEFGRIPYHNVDYDQANEFAPLGEGLLLLTALGGAYLLRKRKQQNNK